MKWGWNRFPRFLAMNIFCRKESKFISKVHSLKVNHPQNPHHSGHRTIFQMLQVPGTSEVGSPKWKAKSVCVTILWHFYLFLLFLQDGSQHINRFSMCCSYMAQDKRNWTAVSWRQFTSRPLKLVIHWRQISTCFLLTPKEDLDIAASQWLLALPAETWVCASHWKSMGKSPQQKLSSWSIAFSCQPHMVLSTESWILILSNHVIISHRHWDIWAIILTASAKADR